MTSPLENRKADRAAPRIRGRKLQAIRQRHFDRDPLCVLCKAEGKTTIATELDHVVPLFKGGLDTDSNRQGLCSSHHKVKTAADLGYTPRVEVGIDGWPVDRG